MDALSDILSGVKLSGALYFSAEFSAPWGFSSPPSNTLARMLAPGAAHLVIFHFVIEGEALVQLADGPSTVLTRGDVIVLPHGDAHQMTSGKGATGGTVAKPNQPFMPSGAVRINSCHDFSTASACSIGQNIGPPYTVWMGCAWN